MVVGKVPYGAVGGGTVYGDRTGLVKLVGESKYGELLGGHIVGSRATELIQELVNVRALEGGFAEVGAHHPRPPDAVRGRDGSRPRRRRLADPRLSRERADAAFYFDLASPLAYLAAERVLHVLARPGRVAAGARARAAAARSASRPSAARRSEDVFRAEIERRARELGLQPLRWPEPFPFDSALAMRAATYAKSIGRTVPFAQAAFRQAFAGGRA